MLYVGGGILKARAAEALRELAELTDIHVVTTLMARGAFPDDHPLCLGMPGMHGNATAVTAMQKADLLIALGARFDDRVTGKVSTFAPEAKVIHVDIDPAEQGKVRRPDVPIVGDCRLVIEEIVKAIKRPARRRRRRRPTLGAWKSRDQRLARAVPAHLRAERAGRRAQAAVLPRAAPRRRARGHDPASAASASTRCGASSTGSSTSRTRGSTPAASARWASAVPAAIGAKVGRPDRTVWAIDGDGCFQMTAQELVTARVERIPIKVAILNNSYLGMVRQWQEMFYDERYSEVYLSPDAARLRQVGGGDGLRRHPRRRARGGRSRRSTRRTRSTTARSSSTSASTPAEKVFPMVPAGSQQRRPRAAPAQTTARSSLR